MAKLNIKLKTSILLVILINIISCSASKIPSEPEKERYEQSLEELEKIKLHYLMKADLPNNPIDASIVYLISEQKRLKKNQDELYDVLLRVTKDIKNHKEQVTRIFEKLLVKYEKSNEEFTKLLNDCKKFKEEVK